MSEVQRRPAYGRSVMSPRRIYRDYKPASHLHLADYYAPGRAEHWEHVDAVKRALGGKGFPFYPTLAGTRP